jgi:hypothetical protein
MKPPRHPTLAVWKIELVRDAMRVIKRENGRAVTAAIARRIPSFSLVDIEIAMRLLRKQQRSEPEADR